MQEFMQECIGWKPKDLYRILDSIVQVVFDLKKLHHDQSVFPYFFNDDAKGFIYISENGIVKVSRHF